MPTITTERLRKLFRLDPETGRIYWRIDCDTTGHNNRWPHSAGDEAGRIDRQPTGHAYWRICVDRWRLGRGPLVFVLLRGWWSPWKLGRYNGDSLDDRPVNLYVIRRGTRVPRPKNLGKFGL